VNEHPSQAFWAEMSACEHFVQIYEADDVFMDTLTGFVAGALRQDEGAVVIATPAHRDELSWRLECDGFDVSAAKRDERLLLLDADETISKFMRDGWPDEDKFAEIIRDILARAGRGGRRVRAFGEMVALMWAKGYCAATVRLEHLWHQLCERESFVLFCAYPKAGFTENPAESMARVCAEHSKVFPA
jgi:hypothetical protein